MNPFRPVLILGLGCLALLPTLPAKSINVNFTPIAGDTVDVDADESSFIGIPGAETVAGAGWNNIRSRPAGSPGAPTEFTNATQGGNHIDLFDSSSVDSGVDMTSSGDFFFNFGNVSAPAQASTGDAGLMQSYILSSSAETISLSGLASWAPDGYMVYAVFDIGDQGPRTYGISVTDGATTQSFWSADSDSDAGGGVDTDTNNDGVIEWLQTSAATEGAAVADANYAVFGTFTGDTMTISGAGIRAPISGFQVVAMGDDPPAPQALNINFGLVLNDANSVDTDEASVVGLTGAQTTAGSGWNNLLLLTSGFGAPTEFTAATQGGNHLDLVDSTGTDAGVDLTSSGSFWSNYGDVSTPNQTATGDAGLFQSYLLVNNGETVDLSGLTAWAPDGYRVRAFFDIGPVTRTYGVTMHDGGAPQTFWTADSAGTDSDPDNDGTITWIESSATTEASAVADANHALFGPFTGDSLSITAQSPSGRAALSGIQIIPNTEPLATINSFTVTPDSFTAGGTVTLAWDVSDADSVTINQGIGTVAATGNLPLTPGTTTTWTLTAVRGGSQVTARATATLSKGVIDVYLLSGQSNMQGTARSSKLPAELLSIPEIQLYAAGSGVSGSIANQWVDLQPANGGTFGPEIGIGERLRDLCPGQPIALIKYAASGNSLEIDFRPGADASDTGNWGGAFTAMVNTFNNGLAALEADGWQPLIHGMCWQQGEQDAKDGLNVNESNTSADDYGANLAHFIGRVREQFAAHAGPDGIRFAPGQVLPYAPAGGDVQARFPGRDLVRQAILDVDEDSGAPVSVLNTRAVPTNPTDHPSHAQEIDGYRDTDEVHQNAAALLAIGRSMAYAMLDVDPQSYLDWASSFSLVGGPDDDDDSDGLSNRTEYLLGGEPTDSADSPRPTLGMADHSGDTVPTYTLTRNLQASEAVPDIQFSTDLVDWTINPPVFISSVKQSDDTAILTFHGPWPIAEPGQPRGFFRTVEK